MVNLSINKIKKLVILIRGKEVLLDREVANIYGVQTKRINEVVKNNINKFPKDYMFQLKESEFIFLRSLRAATNFEKVWVLPKVFTEKRLYMLATVLRSKKANDVSFQIIETFSKIRELSKNINQLSIIKNKNKSSKIIQKSGKIFNDLLEYNSQSINSETSFEINFAVLKFKHIIKK